jgi:hypothetical protein
VSGSIASIDEQYRGSNSIRGPFPHTKSYSPEICDMGGRSFLLPAAQMNWIGIGRGVKSVSLEEVKKIESCGIKSSTIC